MMFTDRVMWIPYFWHLPELKFLLIYVIMLSIHVSLNLHFISVLLIILFPERKFDLLVNLLGTKAARQNYAKLHF